MWMAQKLTEPATNGSHQLGKVTGTDGTNVLVQGDTFYQKLVLSAPWGIAWLPPEGSTAVVLSSGVGEGQQDVCVGTLPVQAVVNPGELRLVSAGGAEIYLKNTGEVVINGQTFPKKEE